MSKAMTQADKLAKLREIIKQVDICLLTTVVAQGELHSCPMSNNLGIR
jgi:general stress protein 26